MKFQKQLFYSLFLAIGLLLTSCQKESGEVIEIVPENTHQLDSQLVQLIRAMAMNDGSVDNFIDGHDCFSIAFPFEVYVDSIYINVTSSSDYVAVADVIEETEANFDDIEIVYPISIILSDYTEVYINSVEDLDDNLLDCDFLNIGIDCLDINYPLTLFVFNSDQDTSNSYVVNSDFELYPFLSNMSEEDYISIQFPISVTTEENEVIEVIDDVMLQDLINQCVEQEIDPNILTEYLINDVWYVNFNFQDTDNTQSFCEYQIDFNVNGEVVATKGNNSVYGNWNIGYQDDAIYVELIFENEAPLNGLNDKWFVINASSDILGFEKTGNLGTIDVLIIDHNPTGC